MICPRCHGSMEDPEEDGACSYCAGDGTVSEMWLSPRFALSTLVRSETAARHKIPNEPNAQQLDNLRAWAKAVGDPLVEMWGRTRVSSGLRQPAVNALVGGSRTSDHCRGNAVDLVPLECSLVDAAQVVLDSRLPYDQLIYEFGSWLHVSHRPGAVPRRQALMIFGGGKYEALDLKDKRIAGAA